MDDGVRLILGQWPEYSQSLALCDKVGSRQHRYITTHRDIRGGYLASAVHLPGLESERL